MENKNSSLRGRYTVFIVTGRCLILSQASENGWGRVKASYLTIVFSWSCAHYHLKTFVLVKRRLYLSFFQKSRKKRRRNNKRPKSRRRVQWRWLSSLQGERSAVQSRMGGVDAFVAGNQCTSTLKVSVGTVGWLPLWGTKRISAPESAPFLSGLNTIPPIMLLYKRLPTIRV